MKYQPFVLFIVMMICTAVCSAQSNNNNNNIANYNGNQLANKLAKKMQDSLDLTNQQRQQIRDINMQLHQQKMSVRNQYTGQDSVLRVKTQEVENTRDNLYRPVLGEQKYIVYRQKKINLLRMN
jgi:Spy/CpxP family protein refolding chaperone